MKFVDAFFDRAARYSLGIETESDAPYMSIPVSSSLADYEEYYALTASEYDDFRADPRLAEEFADSCRRREHDDRLMLEPGWNRGTPR